MRIRIITIHGIPNFGSVFQSYALCKYLKEAGYDDTELIDYNPDYFNKKTLRSRLGQILNYGSYKRRTKKFRGFIEKNLPLTEQKFTTINELRNVEMSADIYIAGGDQLWNIYHDSGNDDAYKLIWATGKKISYATSLGQTDFSREQIKELVEKIKDFSAISVRESSSVGMLQSSGLSAVQCVDPVFLLRASDYESFIVPIKHERYILVYLVNPSKLLDECIDYLRKKYNLKVILCSGLSKKCKCDVFLKDLGPDEVLSYIKNADIVLSSSFHATVFSIIFKKQFFTILPDQHTNERILDILTIFGLKNRIITNASDLTSPFDNQIDFKKINGYDEKIDFSKEYLKMNLKL